MKIKKITEPLIENINFNIHKFSNRPRPNDKRNIRIFPCFSEFGCEIIAAIYCLPKLLQNKYIGKYTIVLGWHGRSYLYKHLVDEFWEINEEHQWLREHSRAFHHVSKNLKKVEKKAKDIGIVVDGEIAQMAVFPTLTICPAIRNKKRCNGEITLIKSGQLCKKCGLIFHSPGIFNDVVQTKKEAVWLPSPSANKLVIAKERYLKANSVGVVARNRKTYGRNLPPIFYERLIYLLEDLGYNPIWLGEPASTLECPIKRITDFRSSEDSKDLEMTLALVSQLKFTIQFWTASSRLSGIVGTPYIIFESPDQIFGKGQEGFRINLSTKEERKLVISHFKQCLENQTETLETVKKAIKEIEDNNYKDIIGQVGSSEFIEKLRFNNLIRIGSI